MAERLTEHKTRKGVTEIVVKPCVDINIVIHKLCLFEKNKEKYDIESFELLEHIIKKGKVINSVIEDFAKEEYDKMKQDRDTWQKACELACRHIAEVEWLSCPETDDIDKSENEIRTLTKQSLYYFYQQAKKEGENGN